MPSSTIITKVCGYEMEISFDWHKAYKGRREGGQQLEPDEDAGIDDITALKLVNPADILEIVSEEVAITMDDVLAAVEAYEED